MAGRWSVKMEKHGSYNGYGYNIQVFMPSGLPEMCSILFWNSSSNENDELRRIDQGRGVCRDTGQ